MTASSRSDDYSISKILESLKRDRAPATNSQEHVLFEENENEEPNSEEVVKSIDIQASKSQKVRSEVPRKSSDDTPTGMSAQAQVREFKSKHNITALLDLDMPEARDFREIITFLRRSRIYHAISHSPTIYLDHIRAFWNTAIYDCRHEPPVIRARVDNTDIAISEATVREALQFGDAEADGGRLEYPRVVRIKAFLRMGFKGDVGDPQFRKSGVLGQWRYLVHVLIMSLSARKAGTDGLNTSLQSAMISLTYNKDFNFARFVFYELEKQIRATGRESFLMYPRFIQIILNHVLPNLSVTNIIKVADMSKRIFADCKTHSVKKSVAQRPENVALFGYLVNKNYVAQASDGWVDVEEEEEEEEEDAENPEEGAAENQRSGDIQIPNVEAPKAPQQPPVVEHHVEDVEQVGANQVVNVENAVDNVIAEIDQELSNQAEVIQENAPNDERVNDSETYNSENAESASKEDDSEAIGSDKDDDDDDDEDRILIENQVKFVKPRKKRRYLSKTMVLPPESSTGKRKKDDNDDDYNPDPSEGEDEDEDDVDQYTVRQRRVNQKHDKPAGVASMITEPPSVPVTVEVSIPTAPAISVPSVVIVSSPTLIPQVVTKDDDVVQNYLPIDADDFVDDGRESCPQCHQNLKEAKLKGSSGATDDLQDQSTNGMQTATLSDNPQDTSSVLPVLAPSVYHQPATVEDPCTSEGLWRGNAVGQPAKEILQAVEDRYPDTFQGLQILPRPYWLSTLQALHDFIKGFLETSVHALAEDQLASLETDLTFFERIGFNLSWARNRLHMVKSLKFGNDPLRLELVEANARFEKARLEYDRANDARNKKLHEVAQKFGAEYDGVLNGDLGFGMLPGY